MNKMKYCSYKKVLITQKGHLTCGGGHFPSHCEIFLVCLHFNIIGGLYIQNLAHRKIYTFWWCSIYIFVYGFPTWIYLKNYIRNSAGLLEVKTLMNETNLTVILCQALQLSCQQLLDTIEQFNIVNCKSRPLKTRPIVNVVNCFSPVGPKWLT